MGLGSELMEAPEDEETFDMMNDETFGDVDDGKLLAIIQLRQITSQNTQPIIIAFCHWD